MSKKIVICASVTFENEIRCWVKKLNNHGYSVIAYPTKIKGDVTKGYKKAFFDCYDNIKNCDILFVMNEEKNNIPGYIGSAVFAEMAFAIGLNQTQGKKIEIFCLNKIPESLPHSEELKLWEDLGWIKYWK